MRHRLTVGVHLCRKLFATALVVSVFGIGVYHTALSSWQQAPSLTPRTQQQNLTSFEAVDVPPPSGYYLTSLRNASNSTEATVLVVYDSSVSKLAEQVGKFLEAHRVPFVLHVRTSAARLAWVEARNGTARGLYGLLVVVDFASFFSHWSERERRTCTDYCKRFGVSAVYLSNSDGRMKKTLRSGNATLGVRVWSPKAVNITSTVPFNHTKPGIVVERVPNSAAWLTFTTPPPGTARVIGTEVWASLVTRHKAVRHTVFLVREEAMVSAFFGMPFDFWLSKLLFLDALDILCDPLVPALRYGRDRLVMVDIDDIFVGDPDMRLHKDDVEVGVAM